jgi:branched-chain amino acid aminotransferase
MGPQPEYTGDGYIWFDGALRPRSDATLPVLSHGLHYASTVFEGERAYRGAIFKSTEHSERLLRSARLLDFEIPFDVATLDAAKRAVVAANGFQNCYLRPVAWRGGETMAVAARHSSVHVAIAAWDWPSMFDPDEKMKGVRLDIADYRRPDPRTAPYLAKASGLYMICTISKHAAERKGYADAMMLDWRGFVAECTGANIMFARQGVVHTPIADCFLDGVTRRTIIALARRRGMQVAERHIAPEELADFDECFLCGTGAEVTPVSEIGPYRFAPGRTTRLLMDDYAREVNAG